MTLPRVALLVATLVVAGACSDGPAATVFVSDPVPRCVPAAGTGECDEFDGSGIAAALADLSPAELDVDLLRERTGLEWRRTRRPEPALVDLAAVHEGVPEDVAAYVLEIVEADAPGERVLSIASNAGMALWIDGEPVLRSRYARRGLNRHSDVVGMRVEPGGHALLYRVIRGGEEWRFHREWWPADDARGVLSHAIDHGAYADLPLHPIIDDTATAIDLKAPSVALSALPTVRFRWSGLLGEPMEEVGSWTGTLPARMPLPHGWDGAAVLQTEVVDPVDGRMLYREDFPLFAAGAAEARAAELVSAPPLDDPIFEARVAAVRSLFGLDPDTSPGSPGLRALALTSLHRIVHDPGGFATYPGPQVWGYRSDDGAVVPYWLTVPPGLEGPGARPHPLVFAVHHFVDPDYWRGRGAGPGPVIQQATLSGGVGGFGVIPHLGGSHDLGEVGASELTAITRQVAAALPVDTARIGLLVWSQHATGALQIALDPAVHLSQLTLAVPDVPGPFLDPVLFALQRVRPGLRVELWSGAQDEVIPPSRVEVMAEAFRDRGFTVEHVEVPNSAHRSGLFHDIQAATRRALVARRGNAPTPAPVGVDPPAR